MQLLRDKVLRETYMCSKVCGMISRGELRENHPQQRKSGQWDSETRDNFIATVIMNWDFDPIKICEQLTDEGVILWLIDGLQRSTTIADFKAGRFKLGKNIEPYIVEYQVTEKDENGKMVNKNVEYDLRGKSYAELPEKLKEDFDNCPVMVVKHLDCTDKEIGRHIVRYNSGSKMVTGQKLATYLPTKAQKVKQLSNHPFFNDCANYKESLDKNGGIDKVVCDSLMFTYCFDKWTRNVKKIGGLIESCITEEMFERTENQMDRLLEIISIEKGQYFSTKNALLWFKLFNKFSDLGLGDDKFVEFLDAFEEIKKKEIPLSKKYTINKGTKEEKETNLLSFADLDSLGSSKDKGLLTDKMYLLESLMMEFLHSDIEKSELVEGDSISNEADNEEILDFVKEVVNPNTTEKDIDMYYDMLNKYKIDKHSPLLHWDNEYSLIALIAYTYINEIDLDDWIVDYFNRNTEFFADQKENYTYMLEDLKEYLEKQKEKVGAA